METMTLPDIVLRGPYLQSIDHVHDELTRIELLVRAQVVRWQMSSACAGPERDWGMVLVSRDEVDHYLKSSIEAPGTLPAAVWKCVKPWWDQADQLRAQIDKHCKDHPSHDLRLDALTALFNLGSSEKDILLLCLLAESGERFRRLFAYLQNDASRQTLNLDLIAQILRDSLPSSASVRDLFTPSANLLRHHLLVVNLDPASPDPLFLIPIRRTPAFLESCSLLDIPSSNPSMSAKTPANFLSSFRSHCTSVSVNSTKLSASFFPVPIPASPQKSLAVSP